MPKRNWWQILLLGRDLDRHLWFLESRIDGIELCLQGEIDRLRKRVEELEKQHT